PSRTKASQISCAPDRVLGETVRSATLRLVTSFIGAATGMLLQVLRRIERAKKGSKKFKRENPRTSLGARARFNESMTQAAFAPRRISPSTSTRLRMTDTSPSTALPTSARAEGEREGCET